MLYMKNIFIMTVSTLLIAPFALANEDLVGEWELQSVVCGIPGVSPPGMVAPQSTTILKNDGSFQVTAPLPDPSMESCSLITEGSYSITGSKMITEIKSIKPDVDCLKALGLNEEDIREVSEILSASLGLAKKGENKRKLLVTKKEQEFVIESGYLYTEHDLSDSFSSLFCEAGETLFFKSARSQPAVE